MGYLCQRDAVADQIVFDDLRCGDDDSGRLEQLGAIFGANLAGEDDDLVVGDREGLPVEVGVLLDERFVGASSSDVPPTSWSRSAVTSRLTLVLPSPVGRQTSVWPAFAASANWSW